MTQAEKLRRKAMELARKLALVENAIAYQLGLDPPHYPVPAIKRSVEIGSRYVYILNYNLPNSPDSVTIGGYWYA